MNIRNVIEHELKKPSHIVKVSDKENGLRLKKDNALMRYAYSLQDITESFGTIDNFLSHLVEQGFRNTTFLFQRTYGSPEKATYHNPKEVTANLQEQINTSLAMSSDIPTHTPSPTPPQAQMPAHFLATPSTGANPVHYLGALVDSERVGDYKKRISDLEEDNKDYRSKIRRLEEENASYKIAAATAEQNYDLKLKQALLEKKGFFESEGVQKIGETLAGLAGQALPYFMNKGAAPTTALGAPTENLSPMKAQAIEMLKQGSDENAGFVAYVLQNMSDGLVEVLQNYIENQN